jgi:NAD+ synthetase
MHQISIELRKARAFNEKHVADAKLRRIEAWFSKNNLNAAVVGVSGGVDSALTLALLMHAKIRRVVALLIPVHGSRGATRQAEALNNGRRVAAALSAEYWEVPLGDSLSAMLNSLKKGSNLQLDAWSEGQCLSVLRTPALYGAAALLQAHGHRSVVVGTTNRDEGGYLGFFGKASDAMVDLQPISDLHKSEVRALASYLGVPSDIVNATPTGDVFDGRTDEELIGASYDDVELFLRLKECNRNPRAFMTKSGEAIEEAHTINFHKYLSTGVAIHLDVMPRGVPGGWHDSIFTTSRKEQSPQESSIPGAWFPQQANLIAALDPFESRMTVSRDISLSKIHDQQGAVIRVVDNVLTRKDCEQLVAAMAESGRSSAVGVTGLANSGSYGIGSTRATAWAPDLADALFARLRPSMPSVRFLSHDYGFTDCFATSCRAAHDCWRLVGLTPLLRFMRYRSGGRHFGHYDSAYEYGDGRRTLMSVVFYLSDAATTGATRFLRDRNGQEALPTHQRDFSDWDRDTRDDEILARVLPVRGSALVFDHRLCHDVECWADTGDRVIIRADLVYEAIPPSPWSKG